MDSIIKIKDLHFSYDGPKILENIQIDIQRNEFIGMVGPNGSGKTTLLKIIMGVLTPDKGTIEVLGKPPFQSVKEIGYMPQLTPFSRDFPISVEEVVLMGRLGKTSSIGFFNKDDKRAAEKSMDDVEILELRKRAIGSLSGGQLQRVLIARALTCEPKIMILDEPTANVDMKIEKDIFDLLKRLNENVTIIVVTHDIGFISQYIHRVACINRTLICHPTSELTGETIENMYGTHMHMVHHHHGDEKNIMSSFFDAVSSQAFMQNAIVGGILASVACGVVGSYVVVKRIGYLAGGIAHSVLGGMGIAYYLGRPPIEGALVAALVFAVILGWVSLRLQQQEDTVIGALWAGGMAIGILFISKSPGYNIDLMSFLFGNILMISSDDLFWIAGLDVLILLIVFLFYKQFLAVSFDEEFARLRGIPVERFYLLFLALVALTVVILIQIVGLILVIALLTLPAAVSGLYVRSLNLMMLLATLLGVVFTTGGLAISYQPDLPPGPTIILVAGAFYLLSLVITRFWKKA